MLSKEFWRIVFGVIIDICFSEIWVMRIEFEGVRYLWCGVVSCGVFILIDVLLIIWKYVMGFVVCLNFYLLSYE